MPSNEAWVESRNLSYNEIYRIACDTAIVNYHRIICQTHTYSTDCIRLYVATTHKTKESANYYIKLPIISNRKNNVLYLYIITYWRFVLVAHMYKNQTTNHHQGNLQIIFILILFLICLVKWSSRVFSIICMYIYKIILQSCPPTTYHIQSHSFDYPIFNIWYFIFIYSFHIGFTEKIFIIIKK